MSECPASLWLKSLPQSEVRGHLTHGCRGRCFWMRESFTDMSEHVPLISSRGVRIRAVLFLDWRPTKAGELEHNLPSVLLTRWLSISSHLKEGQNPGVPLQLCKAPKITRQWSKSNSKHWFTTSFLQGRCRKAMLGVWEQVSNLVFYTQSTGVLRPVNQYGFIRATKQWKIKKRF